MALSRRFDRALHEDLLATEAALLTCKYEGSWLEVYDVHYLTPLVRYWNRLHQELYWRLHGCFFAWHARRGLPLFARINGSHPAATRAATPTRLATCPLANSV